MNLQLSPDQLFFEQGDGEEARLESLSGRLGHAQQRVLGAVELFKLACCLKATKR